MSTLGQGLCGDFPGLDGPGLKILCGLVLDEEM